MPNSTRTETCLPWIDAMLAREMLDHTSQTSLPSPLARERVHTITWPGCDCYVLERVPVRLPNSHSFSKLGGYTLGINTISWVDQFRITPLDREKPWHSFHSTDGSFSERTVVWNMENDNAVCHSGCHLNKELSASLNQRSSRLLLPGRC